MEKGERRINVMKQNRQTDEVKEKISFLVKDVLMPVNGSLKKNSS